MKEYYYFDYLKKDVKYSDYLKSELDKRIYYFGNHFKNRFENENNRKLLKTCLLYIFSFVTIKYFYFPKKRRNELNVISSAYFKFGGQLNKSGFRSYPTPWSINKSGSLLSLREFITLRIFIYNLEISNFAAITGIEFEKKIERVSILLNKILINRKIVGVFLPQDVGILERITISHAKKLGIPTFVVLHGWALRYGNTVNDNYADYICVHGEALRDNLISSGFKREKILVIGHPYYSNMIYPTQLRFSFEDILVISKPLPGQPLEIDNRLFGRSKDTNRLKDRGNAILYLLMIKNVLRQFGVNNVRLRVHPSESPSWYLKFLGSDFFIIDKEVLNRSLKSSTLVIGPTSSMFIDALFSGVNYVIFEPLYDDGLDILNDPVGFPFDGLTENIPVAQDEESLLDILIKKTSLNLNDMSKLVSPMVNLSKIVEILNKKVPYQY